MLNQSGGLITYNGTGPLTVTGPIVNTGFFEDTFSPNNSGNYTVHLPSTVIINGPGVGSAFQAASIIKLQWPHRSRA